MSKSVNWAYYRKQVKKLKDRHAFYGEPLPDLPTYPAVFALGAITGMLLTIVLLFLYLLK